jgi:hypothetical protein
MQEDTHCGNRSNTQFAFLVIQFVIFLALSISLEIYSLKHIYRLRDLTCRCPYSEAMPTVILYAYWYLKIDVVQELSGVLYL